MQPAQIFGATDRPRHLVSRVAEMEKIRDSITRNGDECRIVLIEGPGGLGKTRILEEILRRLGHKEMLEWYGPPLPEHNWSDLDVTVANIIDFTNIKIQAREYFLQTLGDSATWNEQLQFNNYSVQRDQWRRLVDFGVAFSLVSMAAEEAEKAFWQDYKEAAKSTRLVLPLDTTEQLAVISSQWLLDHKLLQLEDMVFNTQQWLLKQIEQGKFKNTTLLIAGRGREGKVFFDALKRAVKKAGSTCEQISVELNPFSLEETVQYFETLIRDWQKPQQRNESIADDVRFTLEDLLTNKDHMKVLWLYTGGQPVRLSLYTDILIEGRDLPAPLKDTFEEAQKRTESDGKKETKELLAAREEIEREFIDLLFKGGGSLHAQILQTLVRTPRGLTAEQLHFVLDSNPYDTATAWVLDDERLAEITQELEGIRSLSIIRAKAGKRVGLQDEVYSIYANRMADDDKAREDEVMARRILYRKLQAWSENRVAELKKDRTDYVKQELARITIEEKPSNVRQSIYFMTPPDPVEEEERDQLAVDLLDAELEYLHYSLLLNPEEHFNTTYYRLASTRIISTYNETESTIFQAEMWRVLHDDPVLEFIPLKNRFPIKARGEKPITVLRRAAQQDDVIQWIMRWGYKGDYTKAISLADRVEEIVNKLEDKNEKHSWSHSLARGERACWRGYFCVLKGQDIQKTINSSYAPFLPKLIALSEADTETKVFEENDEWGFIGHPAHTRLLFLIAIMYNNLGYAFVNLGNYRQAVSAYTSSLKYMRSLEASDESMEATTRNNLSRALVEMGKRRAARVCHDALNLRIEQGDLLPIAYSYNTLALILNDLKRPQQAYEASARALAIAERVGDPRAIGLTLLQVGEALRRMANTAANNIGYGQAEEIYRKAENFLQQALEIFVKSDASGESVRLVEVKLELGSLYRDWVAHSRDVPARTLNLRQKSSLKNLNEAYQSANNRGFNHLALDALVNKAWTYYYANEIGETEAILSEVIALVKQIESELLSTPQRSGRLLFVDPTNTPNYLYKQMSKIANLQGQIALQHFFVGTEEIARANPDSTKEDRQKLVHRDQALQSYLRQAAKAYTLSLAYAQLFAPGSAPLTTAYDDLYEYLKKLNKTEMMDFYRYEREFHRIYQIGKLPLENFGDLEEFLLDCFGDYYDLPLNWKEVK